MTTYKPVQFNSSGLSSRQLWAHDHITRCTCCGAWEIVTDIELRMRAAEMLPPATDCHHLNPSVDKEAS